MRGSNHPSTADLRMRGTFPSYYKSKRWSVLREGLTFVKTYEWAAALRFYAFLSPVIFLNQGYKPREGIFLESQNRKLFFLVDFSPVLQCPRLSWLQSGRQPAHNYSQHRNRLPFEENWWLRGSTYFVRGAIDQMSSRCNHPSQTIERLKSRSHRRETLRRRRSSPPVAIIDVGISPKRKMSLTASKCSL